MRLSRHLFLIGLLLPFVQPQPVRAQGFFESLFGGGSVSSSPSRPHAPRYSTFRDHYDGPGAVPPWWQQSPYQSQRTQPRHYTVMCVRMCDGYYFPMSHHAERSEFHALAAKCERNCSSEARLFYMPASGGTIETMTDLAGRAYEHTDSAFVYRKKLINACTCKPMPWSTRARARHVEYALNDAKRRLAEKKADTVRTKRQNAKNSRTIMSSLDSEDLDQSQTKPKASNNYSVLDSDESDVGRAEDHTAQRTSPRRKTRARRAHRNGSYRRSARHRVSRGSQTKYLWPGDRY